MITIFTQLVYLWDLLRRDSFWCWASNAGHDGCQARSLMMNGLRKCSSTKLENKRVEQVLPGGWFGHGCSNNIYTCKSM
jgi:hypothetical protein